MSQVMDYGQRSEDLKHWWDGKKWVPIEAPAPESGLPVTEPQRRGSQWPGLMRGNPEVQIGATQPDNRVTVSAGTAFKIGFFGAIGFAVAGVVFWIAVALLFAGAAAGLLHSATGR